MTAPRARATAPQLRVVPPPAAPARLPSPALDDSELLTSMKAGDPAAATAVHDRLRPVVESTIRKLLGAGDRDHEDLAQQSMIQIVTTIDRFRGECPLDAWASSVAAHVVFNQIRRRTTERRLFDAYAPTDHESLASTRSLTQETSVRSTLRRIAEHLAAIEEAKAWTYVLHDVCGYDLREVARITNASVAAAQSRLVRGRRELHERIGADPELCHLLEEKG